MCSGGVTWTFAPLLLLFYQKSVGPVEFVSARRHGDWQGLCCADVSFGKQDSGRKMGLGRIVSYVALFMTEMRTFVRALAVICSFTAHQRLHLRHSKTLPSSYQLTDGRHHVAF